jgi:uncharacterized coiled-coil protein SlyX
MADVEIIKLDKKVAVIEQKIDNLSDKIASYQADNKEDHKRMVDLVTTIETKKADKDVVDALVRNQNRIAWTVISAVLLAVIGLVIKINI